MIAFTVAVIFMTITPGPGVLTTAGIGAGYGSRAGLAFLVGLNLGTNLVAVAVVSGLAAVMLSVPGLRTVLLGASIAYLFYLALRIALSGTKVAFIETKRAPGFLGGLALQAINPKAYAVSTALFTGFAFWPESLLAETLVKFAILNAIWVPVHLLWLTAGVQTKRLALSQRAQSTINVAMATTMLAVVALAALS